MSQSILKRFLFFFLVFNLEAFAQESLKILAWNVYMLPPPIKFSKQKERTRLQINVLKELVEENDVVVLTEAFQSRYKKKVLKELKDFYPHHLIQKRKGGIFQLKFMSSGVMILSKYPIKFLGQVYYSKCTIADCLASKGALLVEVTLASGSKVQVLATHMQSGESLKSVKVRETQIDEIKQLLEEFVQPGIPQLVAGDLNIDSNLGDEFHFMISELNLAPIAENMMRVNTIAEVVDCFGKTYKGSHENLDHILLKPNGAEVSLSAEKVLPLKALFSSKKECDLSDHHPVHSTLVFNSRFPSSLRKKTFQNPLLVPDYPRSN